jgi:hypothetical protein
MFENILISLFCSVKFYMWGNGDGRGNLVGQLPLAALERSGSREMVRTVCLGATSKVTEVIFWWESDRVGRVAT